MSKHFADLDTDGMEQAEDRVGGGFTPFPSDIYDAKITMAYLGESARGAKSVTIHADIDGKEYRQTIYISNAEGKAYYVDQATKQKLPLAGFSTINDLCLFATDAELKDQEPETKLVKVYDRQARTEVPTEVEALTSLIGAEVKLVIQRQIQNQRKQDDGGKWVDTADTRMVNELIKVLDKETSRTTREVIDESEEANYAEAWLKQWQGKDRDRTVAVSGGAGSTGTGRPGRPGAAPGAAAEKPKKIFGKK